MYITRVRTIVSLLLLRSLVLRKVFSGSSFLQRLDKKLNLFPLPHSSGILVGLHFAKVGGLKCVFVSHLNRSITWWGVDRIKSSLPCTTLLVVLCRLLNDQVGGGARFEVSTCILCCSECGLFYLDSRVASIVVRLNLLLWYLSSCRSMLFWATLPVSLSSALDFLH